MSSKKGCLMLIMLVCLFGLANNSMAMEVETLPYSNQYVEWLNLPEEEKEQVMVPPMYVKKLKNQATMFSMRSRSLGAARKYNLLESGVTLKIKDQKNTESCWAMAATTQLESYMAKVKSKMVEYSPRHMEYATSRYFSDGENVEGYNRSVNSGGNMYLAYSYMTSGRGPIAEKDMPFSTRMSTIPLSEIQNKTVQAQLEEYIIFPSIYKERKNGEMIYSNGQDGANREEYTIAQVTNFRNKIKEHIMKYGAVMASTSTGSTQFFSESIYTSSKAYYCDDSSVKADHQISIIGWDDDYAVTNFNEAHRPTSPGAWLVQNSYGTEIFDAGFLYISYEDCLIETLLGGIVTLGDVDYKTIYQHDVLGMSTAIMTKEKEYFAANVFENNEQEAISEIGFSTIENQSYEIYVNSKNGNLAGSDFIKVKTVPKTESDYITVKLDEPILLTGSDFAVGIKYISEEENAIIPVEANVYAHTKWASATSNRGESFVSADRNNWVDMKDVVVIGTNNMNACIKAFTIDSNNLPKEVTLASNRYRVEQEGKIIANVIPETNVTSFKKNISTTGTIRLYNSQGTELAENEIITTGTILRILETNESYQIVVIGDINGDGKITGTDLVKIKKDLIKMEQLEGIYQTAADMDNSNKVTGTDMLKIKQVICKLIIL